MKPLGATLVLAVLVGAAGAPRAWAAEDISVGGVVRDPHGTPLLGTLVELLGQRTGVVARTFTDEHGRYLLRAVAPGEYQLRAAGAFFLPVTQAHLRLESGARAAVNLTMTAMFAAGALLPAEKRTAGEPADDWRWTLRAVGNRPLLRLVGDDGGLPEDEVAGAASEGVPGRGSPMRGEVRVSAGDGRFGEGQARQEMAMVRACGGNGAALFRAEVDPEIGAGSLLDAGAVRVAAGVEHERTWGGASRILVSFASEPGLLNDAGAGVRVARIAATDEVVLGDELTVDAGSLLTMEQAGGVAVASAPYVRVAFRPAEGVRLEYRLATDRALQQSGDLDRGSLGEEVLTDGTGRPLLKRSLHQELAAVRSTPKRDLRFAVYRDRVPFEGVEGVGALSVQGADGMRVLLDPGTGMLRVAVRGYTGTGVAASVEQVITPVLLARVEGQYGVALGADGGAVLRLGGLGEQLRSQKAAAVTGMLVVHADGSGTVVKVHYRRQPGNTLSQVDAFDVSRDEAYLGMDLRQRLCRGRGLERVDAVVDARNLLAQGYAMVVGSEGQLLHLAQTPRAVQGGLAFTF